MVHKPVLANEVIKYLNVKPEGRYVDATYGLGGHSRMILDKLNEHGKVVAFDVSPIAEQHIINDDRLTFIKSNFRYMKNWLDFLGLIPVDGIIADLGVSSPQLDVASQGFTYRTPAPLDLRMDKDLSVTAEDIIRKFSVEQLAEIISQYGELEPAQAIASAIVEARRKQPIVSSADLVSVTRRFARGNPKRFYSRLFQALRIAVNDELNALKDLLEQAEEVLRVGGRLLIITFHSLEDRIVKQFFAKSEKLEELEDSPVLPSHAETRENRRARSAKLRIAEKVKE